MALPADNEHWERHNAEFDTFKSEVSKLIEDDLKVAGDTSIQAQTIYHYTDVRGALAIIESGHLWFTERAHLNDPIELQYGLRIGHEMFEEAVKRAGPTVPQQTANHLMEEAGVGLIEFGSWVASFSYDGDDLSQWRSYADDGRGVCLGFSVQALDMSIFASKVPGLVNYLRFPVRYATNPSFVDCSGRAFTQRSICSTV